MKGQKGATLMSQMAAYSERNGRTGLGVDMKEPFEGEVTKTEGEGKHAVPCSSKDLHQPVSAANGSTSGVASFSTNPNSVVCLPLVSEGLKLVWTHSDQTRELDSIPELVQAFNLFPYPTTREVNALARVCALTLDKVKVWFMVQRIKYGISWASEEIEETRRKLAVPEISGDYADTKEDVKMTAKRKFCEEMTEDEDTPQIEGAFSTLVSEKDKKTKYESPETYKPARSTVPCFSSSLPPPQDSYNYRPPADTPATTAADVSLDLSDSSVQRRHGRYKKSKAQLAVLRGSFVRENWPAETELRRLQEETGLSRNDIRKWFSDSRYQLRIGRGVHAAAQVYSHQTTVEGKEEPQQVQPLPLISQKSRQQRNDKEVKEGAFSNDINASHFFQTFLSNSLQAFGERSVLEMADKGSGKEEHCKDGEEWEEKPLQLTKTSVKTEAEVPQQPSCVTKSSPSSLSGTPPPTASPHKQQVSNGIGTSKKSSTPSRLSGAPSSTSPALTPGGRPRKTKDQLDVLKQHFLRCQWPKSEDYTELVKVTGLPRADIIQWFGDTRYAVKNGQLRWVQEGVREQFLAELATLQGSNGLSNGNSGSGTPRVGGSRKRKAQANGTGVPTDSPDTQPLEAYLRLTGVLHEKDLDSLCKKSRMSYQQVRDWFSSQESEVKESEVKESGVNDQESNVTD